MIDCLLVLVMCMLIRITVNAARVRGTRNGRGGMFRVPRTMNRDNDRVAFWIDCLLIWESGFVTVRDADPNHEKSFLCAQTRSDHTSMF